VSIVGYTNAGKSTLFNALTGAQVLEEDKLFATLDPTTRRLRLPTNQNALVSDTVGFIRKLPHQLVEAFKATLEEVVNADILIHVVDATLPQAQEQIEAVNVVLEEIGAGGKPVIMVFNKIDQFEDGEKPGALMARFPQGVAVSAKTRAGFPELLEELASQLRPVRDLVELSIPHREAAAISRLHEVAQVLERSYDGQAARFKARLPPFARAEFQPFLIPEGESLS
jgi:GTP-binding protein HflX